MVSIVQRPKMMWDGLKVRFREIRQEVKKVSFPSQKEVIGTTIMVIVSSFLLAVFLWIADYIFQKIIMFIFERFGV